jgi:hypothetical protein
VLHPWAASQTLGDAPCRMHTLLLLLLLLLSSLQLVSVHGAGATYVHMIHKARGGTAPPMSPHPSVALRSMLRQAAA